MVSQFAVVQLVFERKFCEAKCILCFECTDKPPINLDEAAANSGRQISNAREIYYEIHFMFRHYFLK
jgi:hypothetical protein